MEILSNKCYMPIIMADEYTKEIEVDGKLELVPSGLSANHVKDFLCLTPEYRKSVLDTAPSLQENILRIQLLRIREAEDPKNQAKEIHQAIIPGQPQPEQMRFSFSPFPTQLSRTSPFFPISTQEIANREYIRDMVIASHSWGTLTYTGPKLSVYEEDYLMILLALLCDVNARIEETGEEGVATYTYNGHVRQILKMKGIEEPGSNHYNSVLNAYTLMAGASFKLTTKKAGKGKKEPDTTYVNNILSNIQYKHGSGNIKVTVNPYFYQTFGQGMVTWLDVQIRARIKSPTAKALYRFIMSHREDHWNGPLLTLAASMNIDQDLQKIKIRERLKKAIRELVELNVLTKNSIINLDMVDLWRVPRKVPTKKLT